MKKLPKSAFFQKEIHQQNGANSNPSASPICYRSLFLCSSDDDSGCAMDEIYAWVPPRTKSDLVHHFFAALPVEKVPRIGTPGEQWRKRQLERQLPPQDADARFCGNLSAKEETEFSAFVRARFANSLGRGEVRRSSPAAVGTSKLYCHQCKNAIVSDQIAVSAPSHFGPTAFWHPNCFVCVECGELLVDLIYFAHAQNIFCGRHHAELMKPRCSNCDELIFSEECTEAEGRIWHIGHFSCGQCEEPLGGQRYVMDSSDETQPICVRCCRESAKLSCANCAKKIAADRPHIAQGTFHWHADQRCFCCSVCQKALLGMPFSLLPNGLLFCDFHFRFSSAANRLQPKNQPLRLPLPPPPFPPPAPPPLVERQKKSLQIHSAQKHFNFHQWQQQQNAPVFFSASTAPTENIYETVAAVPPPPSADSANGEQSVEKGQRKKWQKTEVNLRRKKQRQKNFRPEASESSETEGNQEKPLRRCRSEDGKGERLRKSGKSQRLNKNGQFGIKNASTAFGTFYSRQPPPTNVCTDGGTLTAALALASTRQKHRRRRTKHRTGHRKRQMLYWERSPASSSSSSADDSDSSLSMRSSSSSGSDAFDRRRNDAFLRHYLNALVVRDANSSLPEKCVSHVNPQMRSVCRMATTRKTTEKCAKNAKTPQNQKRESAGSNCRIS